MTAPENAQPPQVSNENLSPDMVPAPDAPWTDIARFAESYLIFRKERPRDIVASYLDDCRERFAAQRRLPGNLAALREALLHEQERVASGEEHADAGQMTYVQAVMEAIRRHVEGREPEPGQTSVPTRRTVTERSIIERYPHGYGWPKRFPAARRVAGFEGGAVYTTEAEGAFWLIRDEGTMADFLEPGERAELVSLERFDDRVEWERAVEEFCQRQARARRDL